MEKKSPITKENIMFTVTVLSFLFTVFVWIYEKNSQSVTIQNVETSTSKKTESQNHITTKHIEKESKIKDSFGISFLKTVVAIIVVLIAVAITPAIFLLDLPLLLFGCKFAIMKCFWDMVWHGMIVSWCSNVSIEGAAIALVSFFIISGILNLGS